MGWLLDIADQVINRWRRPDGSVEREPIPHSGYAALDIVVSYFEMIAKHEAGYVQVGQSEAHSKEGAYSAFPAMRSLPSPDGAPGVEGKVQNTIDKVLDIMYEGARCGLYHSGIPGGRVLLTGEVQHPMAFDPQNGLLVINPHLLVPALRRHSAEYIGRLREVNDRVPVGASSKGLTATRVADRRTDRPRRPVSVIRRGGPNLKGGGSRGSQERD